MKIKNFVAFAAALVVLALGVWACSNYAGRDALVKILNTASVNTSGSTNDTIHAILTRNKFLIQTRLNTLAKSIALLHNNSTFKQHLKQGLYDLGRIEGSYNVKFSYMKNSYPQALQDMKSSLNTINGNNSEEGLFLSIVDSFMVEGLALYPKILITIIGQSDTASSISSINITPERVAISQTYSPNNNLPSWVATSNGVNYENISGSSIYTQTNWYVGVDYLLPNSYNVLVPAFTAQGERCACLLALFLANDNPCKEIAFGGSRCGVTSENCDCPSVDGNCNPLPN